MINGFFWSGSSAIVDYLMEFDEVSRVPHEFNDFRKLGWIGDLIANEDVGEMQKSLQNHVDLVHQNLQKLENQARLKRLFANAQKVLNKQKSQSHQMHHARHLALVDAVEKLKQRGENGEVSEKVKIAQKWLHTLSLQYSEGSRFLLFDQPLRVCQHQSIWQKVFGNYKQLLVYRDPRDQIADIVQRNKLFDDFIAAEDLSELYGRSRLGAIQYQVDLLNRKLDCALEQARTDTRTLLISFEQFLTFHEKSCARINQFLGINPSKHRNQGKFFRVDQSRKNIGIHTKILEHKDRKLLENVTERYFELERMFSASQF